MSIYIIFPLTTTTQVRDILFAHLAGPTERRKDSSSASPPTRVISLTCHNHPPPMCTRTKLIALSLTSSATSEAGYQIFHCPPEAAYQQVLLDWVKSGQQGPMPRPDPRRGLGCLDIARWGLVQPSLPLSTVSEESRSW